MTPGLRNLAMIVTASGVSLGYRRRVIRWRNGLWSGLSGVVAVIFMAACWVLMFRR